MKRALLIAGGGTLGTYASKELLEAGWAVDVLCPEEKVSDHPQLTFLRGYGTKETLSEIFAAKRYDGVINFIHYPDPLEYEEIHPFLSQNTDHLVFLSSYRAYSGLQVPITEECIAAHLATKGMPDPDLLIRTSGELRISNFLLWQLAYAELYFTDKLWPEFDKEEFYKAIVDYQGRERRFGKTSEQIN